ncbi:hypothetical protein ACFRSX_15745 [Streptomyces goshikiensis]|uniref:hypothetical protein n=1 Tax=Streptomyces TaxID=1883 RepID=UPI000C271AC2|nr:hypothetical protein [Streptomyces sp. CB02120-2]PJN19582.1 hypothetical protein CG724_04800 [Streptomyces sp. CB02120-2]
MRSYRLRCLVAAPPLVISSLAIGPAAFARSAPDAVPAASCQVVANKSAPGTVVFDFQGFNGPFVLTNKDAGTSTTLTGFGTDLHYSGGEKPGIYTATPAGGPSVTCTGNGAAAEAEGEGDQAKAQEQFRTGYQQGLRDTLATCEKNLPKNLAPDPNWQSGYDKGAATALGSKRCTDNG